MVARREQPLFRIETEPDGGRVTLIRCVGFAWVVTESAARADVLDAARGEIAAWLDVDPMGLRVEMDRP